MRCSRSVARSVSSGTVAGAPEFLRVGSSFTASPPARCFHATYQPMKLPKLLLVPAALAAFTLTAFADYTWDFSKATGSGGAVDASDASGNAVLAFANGATIADDAALGTKVLVLDGNQENPGQTARAVEAFPSVELKLKFKAAGNGPDRQTLVAFGNAYEIRYYTKGVLEFIVFHPEKKFTIARVNIAANQWHDVKATYQGGKVVLTVGKNTKEATLPAGIDIEPKGTKIRVGRQGDRAFIGSIAELSFKAL